MRAAAVAAFAFGTLSNLQASPDLAAASARLTRALHPSIGARDVLDGLRNVALTAGVGVVWLATARATGAGGRLRREVTVAGIVGLVLGLLAETAQLFSPVRMSSILDVLTNGLGAFVGAAAIANIIAYGARDAWRRARRRSRPRWLARLGGVPLLYVAVPYTVACWLEAFSPLGRPDRVPGAWGGPERRWSAALAYAAAHAGDFPAPVDLVLFAPAGALVTLWLMERGMRRWHAAALVATILVASWAVAELLRGFSGGDMLVWAVALHGIASTGGAAAAAVWSRHVDRTHGPVARPAPYLLPAFAALVLAWSWRPFVLVTSWRAVAGALRPEAFIPLAELAEIMSVHSVADVGVGALLYAPLGAWLAARAAAAGGTDSTGGLRALWPGVVVGLAAECGQIVIAGRTFDVTDLLVQWAGVLVGAVVWRAAQARARTHGPAARVEGVYAQPTSRASTPVVVRPRNPAARSGR
ncbi:MAG TPA: VanZ family protein [Gemmatirosa sp.]